MTIVGAIYSSVLDDVDYLNIDVKSRAADHPDYGQAREELIQRAERFLTAFLASKTHLADVSKVALGEGTGTTKGATTTAFVLKLDHVDGWAVETRYETAESMTIEEMDSLSVVGLSRVLTQLRSLAAAG